MIFIEYYHYNSKFIRNFYPYLEMKDILFRLFKDDIIVNFNNSLMLYEKGQISV